MNTTTTETDPRVTALAAPWLNTPGLNDATGAAAWLLAITDASDDGEDPEDPDGPEITSTFVAGHDADDDHTVTHLVSTAADRGYLPAGTFLIIDQDSDFTAYYRVAVSHGDFSLVTCGDELRKIGDRTATGAAAAMAVLAECAESATHLKAALTPRVEIVGERDPNGGTDLNVFVNGAWTGAAVVVVDPGASLNGNEDDDTLAEWRAEGYPVPGVMTPAAEAHLRSLLDGYDGY